VVGRAARRGRLDAFEAEIGQIERVDNAINHTNGIALLDLLIEAFRQQRRLSAIGTLNEALAEPPSANRQAIYSRQLVSRSQGHLRRFDSGPVTSDLPSSPDISLHGTK
jgi:hypothetical protein